MRAPLLGRASLDLPSLHRGKELGNRIVKSPRLIDIDKMSRVGNHLHDRAGYQIFPATTHYFDPDEKVERRHHFHESVLHELLDYLLVFW